MKKKLVWLASVLAIVSLLLTGALAETPTVRIPAQVMQNAIKNNDAGSIIEKYLYPMLNEDDSIALLFASELNISNGCPFIRNVFDGGWGERAIFGRLITAGTVEKYMDTEIRPGMSNAELALLACGETYRLLFGKPYDEIVPNTHWLRNGKTTFSFSYRHMTNGKTLDYSTGKWVKTPGVVWCIRAQHTTEYYGEQRNAYIACDWKNEKDGYYTATFGIVR